MKTKHTIVLEPDGEAWLAYIPAVPGCHAPGDTPEEAMRELETVYEMIIEEYTHEGKVLPPDVELIAGAAKS